MMSCNNTQYNGIDISHHNKVCWECIKNDSNIIFCYIKATEGKSYKDPKVINNYKKAKSLKLKTGFYHYYIYNVSAKKQFDNFNNIYKKCDAELIPVIDVEDTGNSYSDIKKFNQNLEELINLFYINYKVYPVIYLGTRNSFKSLPVIYKYKIWFGILPKTKYLPSSIHQLAIKEIGCNKVDINYCNNLNKLLINKN